VQGGECVKCRNAGGLTPAYGNNREGLMLYCGHWMEADHKGLRHELSRTIGATLLMVVMWVVYARAIGAIMAEALRYS
jgi:hypothetical protein